MPSFITKSYRLFQTLVSPPYFYIFTSRLQPYLLVLMLILFAFGLYGALYAAPPDYQQGETYRILYIHVPAAWMSLFVFAFMVVFAIIGQVWRLKIAEILVISASPIGACFTLIALLTGSLWGKPMWGAWWVWDARLTSELLLLFIYLGITVLHKALGESRHADRAVALLVLVGSVNIPIIHYSVQWWSTLHQGPTVSKLDKPSMHISMLVPLLIMTAAFKCYFLANMLQRARLMVLQRESNAQWLKNFRTLDHD